jgi:rRNA processing protein Krr1/Pno1
MNIVIGIYIFSTIVCVIGTFFDMRYVRYTVGSFIKGIALSFFPIFNTLGVFYLIRTNKHIIKFMNKEISNPKR